MEVCRKALSRKGTLGSMPKAKGALLALATSHTCNLSTFLMVSLNASKHCHTTSINLHLLSLGLISCFQSQNVFKFHRHVHPGQ